MDKLAECFRINSVTSPTKGTASIIDSRTVRWRIPELGHDKSEGAVLEFQVEHIGPCTGTVEVNESVSYKDDEKNVVTFPSPEIEIDCGVVVTPEPCPEPVDVKIDGCADAVEYDAGELDMTSLGRILQIDITLRKVCPHNRVALAAILTEVDAKGKEHKRGLKTMTVPAHSRSTCQDVLVRCIKFVLPENLDTTNTPNSICERRYFKVRFIAHYIDSDFDCCDVIY